LEFAHILMIDIFFLNTSKHHGWINFRVLHEFTWDIGQSTTRINKIKYGLRSSIFIHGLVDNSIEDTRVHIPSHLSFSRC
jgi:hypothetical protein